MEAVAVAEKKNSMWPRIAYACGTFGHDVFYAMLATYFMIFVTSNLFSSNNPSRDAYMIGVVTTIIMVLRVAELFIDPFMGNIIDKTKTRWGRFKPWVIVGAFVAAITLAALFTDFGGLTVSNPTLYLILFAIVYFIMDVFYSAKDVAIWSMIPALSFDSHEREVTATIARIGSVFGGQLITVIVMPVVLFFSLNQNGGAGDPTGWLAFACIGGGIATLGAIILGFGTKEQESALREKLETINHLDADGLKELSRETRTTVGFTPEGGASLGLIEMAKRSGNKLDYLIKPVDEAHSYFYLTTEIDTSGGQATDDGKEVYTIQHLIDVHENFNRNSYTLSFKGDFDQENLLSLLSILKSGMSETKTRIKLYGVMVELLQNIVKHADNKEGYTGWKAGVFYIKEHADRFSLLAGNYVAKEKSAALSARIERIDSMDNTGLSKEYNKILFNFNNDPISTGLGFIDIRRKSGSKIEYSIVDAGGGRDFFMAKVDVMKVD